MTETNQTAQPEAVSDADGQTAPPEGHGAAEQNQGLAEARDRYRIERDSAREELATAAARIERMQRAEVERLAGEHLAMPGDLFSLSGNELADYLTDDGDVDAEKVAADVAVVLAERPGLKKGLVRGYDPSQGLGGGGQPKREPSTAGPTDLEPRRP
uniref:Scaffolding protein n=1 Tax=Mycolicibacterium phage Alyssa1 TaxID=3240801 RepID=A0AB39U288_9CAUD